MGGGRREFTITENGHYVGAIGVQPPDPWGVAADRLPGRAVGAWQGRGDQAARAVTEWLFDHGVERVELHAAVENIASLRVAYKAGFQEEGRRRDAKVRRDGRRTDIITFGRIRRDSGYGGRSYLPFFDGGELSDGVIRLTPMEVADASEFHAMMREPSVAAYGSGRGPRWRTTSGAAATPATGGCLGSGSSWRSGTPCPGGSRGTCNWCRWCRRSGRA